MSLPTVVCIGGFPRKDNDHTAEVWYRGVKLKGFSDHKSAEFIAKHLTKFENLYGAESALMYAKSSSRWEWKG